MSSIIIDNYINFIQRHNEYFKHYDTFADVSKTSLSGWLYIFNALCYDEDISKILWYTRSVVIYFAKNLL